MELARMVKLSPKLDPINVSVVASRLGITRQSLYNNKLKKTIEEHAELQRKNFSVETEAAALRQPLEVRIATLEEENQELMRKLDGWIELWATVEYNAKMHGINADLLFAPLKQPLRKTLTFKKGRKNND
jgi:hypothetical protein